MIDCEQLYNDTVSIVKELVNGALAGGCDPNINTLLNDTYDALKALAERIEKDKSKSSGAKITPISRRNN